MRIREFNANRANCEYLLIFSYGIKDSLRPDIFLLKVYYNILFINVIEFEKELG
jgi:hypothetical protein